MSKVQVYRDGEPVSPVFDTPDEGSAWLLHEALTYEGYSIETVES